MSDFEADQKQKAYFEALMDADVQGDRSKALKKAKVSITLYNQWQRDSAFVDFEQGLTEQYLRSLEFKFVMRLQEQMDEGNMTALSLYHKILSEIKDKKVEEVSSGEDKQRLIRSELEDLIEGKIDELKEALQSES